MSENPVTQYLRRRLDLLRGELREVEAAIQHQAQREKHAAGIVDAADKARHRLLDEGLINDANALGATIDRIGGE